MDLQLQGQGPDRSIPPCTLHGPGSLLLFFIWGVYLFGDGLMPVTNRSYTPRFVINIRGMLGRLWKRVRQKRLYAVPWYLKPFVKGIRLKDNKTSYLWRTPKLTTHIKKHYKIIIVVLLTIILVIYSVIKYGSVGFLGLGFLGLGAVINSNGTGGGNWNAGASWSGGTSPTSGDNAVILSGDTITLTQAEISDSLEVQTGGTVAGGGFTYSAWGTDGAGYSVNIDGAITGNFDVELASNIPLGTATIDFIATSGNVRTYTDNTSGVVVTFNGNTVVTGGWVVNGDTRPSANGDTLTCQYLGVNGSLGTATWTGTITLTGGGWYGSGTYTHGNQTVVNSSTGAGEDVSGTFSFYIFNWSGSGTKEFADGATITFESELIVGASVILKVKGSASDTTVNLGTAGASGKITNGGQILFHDASGTGDVIIQAVNTGFYGNLEGAGVYDWDYGAGYGGVYWKWLNHKGSGATAKTTGGGGVDIVMNGRCNFYEDFTVATNDTLDCNSQIIGILKDLTISGTQSNGAGLYLLSTGTGFFSGFSGTVLTIYTDLEYSFDGTNSFSGAVTWDGASVGDLLAYDATSILNVTGGITVPATAYFGGDSAGDMGDNNDVSGWTANMSFGWVNNSGDFYFSSGITTISSHNSNVALTNSDTIYHNNGTLKFTGSALQQINAGGNDLYRVDNSNLSANVEFITSNVNLDGIFFRSGTVTEADTVTVTCQGFTPALGTDTPFDLAGLLANGRALESSGGSFVFDYDPSTEILPGDYRVLYTTSDTAQENVLNVKYKKAMDRYARYAEVYIDDVDGSQADNYTTGDPVRVMYHDDTEWLTVWRGYAEDIDNGGLNHPTAKLICYGFEAWFRKKKVSLDLSFRDHTLHQVLEVLIKTQSPVTWDATLIDTNANPTTLRPIFQGMDVDECIREMLGLSANEEYFVDNNFKFNVRQRATSHDGTYDSPVSYLDTTNITSYDFEEVGSEEVNRVEVKFGSNLDKLAVAEDTARQDALKTQTGASQAVVILQEYSRSDISLLANAQAYADYRLNAKKTYLAGKITSYDSQFVEPGMITEVTIADKSGYSSATAFKILDIEYDHASDTTVLTLIEPAIVVPKLLKFNGIQGRMTGVQAYSEKTDSQVADNTFDTQTKVWDSMADFNTWSLGANIATNVGGFIEASGATVGAETSTSPWIVPGSGKDYVYWWAFVRYIMVQNNGTVTPYVEGDVTGRVALTEDYQLIRDSFANTEQLRLSIDITWNGAGTSGIFSYGSISWK